ncbi:hypothetical protein DL89DRAFT_270139 [Linderina pennispora]|uniref:Uncharacterized protein n=1 Tax=Linderina pennispora TaxID=61395 RepID=A0A1Y1VZA9_9FUNG|nr:uncharacterized protein DL89DRAFT_270139 [Linderina pennispora]ORX66601.1 hypothetical protein DL89DRAFT_270139 [Linderina pennispora]
MKFVSASILDALNSVSSHWNGYTSVINGDMPILQAGQPSIYARLTSHLPSAQSSFVWLPTPIIDAPEAYSEISEHWPAVTSIVNEDMPLLQAGAPSIYKRVTSVIHGTAITETYNKPLVDALVTALPSPLFNNIIYRAGIDDNVDGWSMDSVESVEPTPTPTPTRTHGHGHHGHHDYKPPPLVDMPSIVITKAFM